MRFKEWREKRRREKELEEMDRRWEKSGASSWELFPPSYYYRYTPEELAKMREEKKRLIEKLTEDL